MGLPKNNLWLWGAGKVMLILSTIHAIYSSSNISVSFKNFIIFSTSKSFSVELFFYRHVYYIFLMSFYRKHSSRQCYVFRVCFHMCMLIDCWSFLDIKCPWVSLVCPIRSLLSLTSYCLQLLWALSHSSMWGLM